MSWSSSLLVAARWALARLAPWAVLALTAGAPAAWAGWSMLGFLDGQTYSMDTRAISTTPQGLRRFWALIDYNHATGHGARSIAMELEIDCRQNRIRRIQAVGYRGDVQQGGVVWTSQVQGGWETIARHSLNRSAQLRVCTKPIKGAPIYTSQF
jgi:hypothetical protein